MEPLIATLILVCTGGGTAVKPDVQTVQGHSNVDGSYNHGQSNFNANGTYGGTVHGTREREFTDQVDVEIHDGGGRIRLPRVTLPLVRGGSAGWFDLKEVVVTDRAISAKAAVNVINMPKIHIDRITGSIAINGSGGSYSGQCTAVDVNAEKKF